MLLIPNTAQPYIKPLFSATAMNIDTILNYAETVIHTQTGKYLNDLQRVILHKSLLGVKKTYEQIANEYGYSENYIQQVVATKLWRLLSTGIGEKVTKANVRSVLERNINQANSPHFYTNEHTSQEYQHIKLAAPTEPIFSKTRLLVVYPHQDKVITLVQTLVSALENYELSLKSWESLAQSQHSLELNSINYDYLIMFLDEQCLLSQSIIEMIQGAIALNPIDQEPNLITIFFGVSPKTFSGLENGFHPNLTTIPQWQWSDSGDTPKLIEEIVNYLENTNNNRLQLNEAQCDCCPIAFVELELPKGSVPLKSRFYVERHPYEFRCYQEIVKPGAMITLKAPRQMGKTSLLNRLLNYVANQNYQTVLIDFQKADETILTDTNKLLRWLCASISRQLKLEVKVDEYWDEDLGNKMSCSLYFQEYILKQVQSPLIVALEEVSVVYDYPNNAKTLLTLLRSWHEESKFNSIWQKLGLVLVQSTEAYIPLTINQSPFYGGLEIDLPPFGDKQIQQLARAYELNLSSQDIDVMMNLLGGHPYLVRLTLYHLATKSQSLQDVVQVAATDTGIYREHLHRLLWQLQQHRDLKDAFEQVLNSSQPVTLAQIQGFKLKSLGLVRLNQNQVSISCDLYRNYFSERLS